jgi:hypothetical protein
VAEHYYIYLGKELGKRVVFKTGQTVRDCYLRCKNADYLIGIAIEIDMSPWEDNWSSRKLRLNIVEQDILRVFANRFVVEHGKEYFRAKKYNWEMIKEFWLNEMIAILERKNLNYIIHDGWVSKENYY